MYLLPRFDLRIGINIRAWAQIPAARWITPAVVSSSIEKLKSAFRGAEQYYSRKSQQERGSWAMETTRKQRSKQSAFLFSVSHLK